MAASKGLSLAPEVIERFTQGTGRVVITSSRSGERSGESDQLRNGYFTHYLLEGLSQKEGLVTIDAAYNYLRDNVPKRVMQEKGESQNPVMGKKHPGKRNYHWSTHKLRL